MGPMIVEGYQLTSQQVLDWWKELGDTGFAGPGWPIGKDSYKKFIDRWTEKAGLTSEQVEQKIIDVWVSHVDTLSIPKEIIEHYAAFKQVTFEKAESFLRKDTSAQSFESLKEFREDLSWTLQRVFSYYSHEPAAEMALYSWPLIQKDQPGFEKRDYYIFGQILDSPRFYRYPVQHMDELQSAKTPLDWSSIRTIPPPCPLSGVKSEFYLFY